MYPVLFIQSNHRRRRRGAGRGARAPQNSGKYFSGNYYVKFGHFSDKNHLKFENFVNYFSGKYNKNLGILIFFSGKYHKKSGIIQ